MSCEHRCPGMQDALETGLVVCYPKESGVGGWFLITPDEDEIEINYCPFCGEELWP